jgi:hypothetical protein
MNPNNPKYQGKKWRYYVTTATTSSATATATVNTCIIVHVCAQSNVCSRNAAPDKMSWLPHQCVTQLLTELDTVELNVSCFSIALKMCFFNPSKPKPF